MLLEKVVGSDFQRHDYALSANGLLQAQLAAKADPEKAAMISRAARWLRENCTLDYCGLSIADTKHWLVAVERRKVTPTWLQGTAKRLGWPVQDAGAIQTFLERLGNVTITA